MTSGAGGKRENSAAKIFLYQLFAWSHGKQVSSFVDGSRGTQKDI